MATVPQSIQEVIVDYLNRVGNQIKIQKAILFGSYARQQFNSESDIDLAVFSDDFIGMEPIDRFRLLFLTATDYGVDLQPLAFTTNDLLEPDGLVKEIINTGVEIAISN
ncbi:MAG: nucleotidyltransferase domain-containing protein [Desulfitobacterium hafniense]|nr:nucleotidyltransferase domain-containing protein [Desulfitobacterium hafniense]